MPYYHALSPLLVQVSRLYYTSTATTLVADFEFYNLSQGKDPIVTQVAFYTLSGEVVVNITVSYTNDNGHPIGPHEAARIAAFLYNRCGEIVPDTDMEYL